MNDVRAAIEEMVNRETRAWDTQDAESLVELFHPDMVWPWPPTAQDHDPQTWVFFMGRYQRERWKKSWQELFDTHKLVHNKRTIRKIEISQQGDAALAVVDIDTLWRDQQGRDNHWKGRVSKGYTRMKNGEWKLIFHTGVLEY
ncbi:MAG: YybH family protein [Terriglobales bacterium]